MDAGPGYRREAGSWWVKTRHRDSKAQRHRGTEAQRFKGTEVQRHRGTKNKGYEDQGFSGLRGFKGKII
jgi:hypothetical protein